MDVKSQVFPSGFQVVVLKAACREELTGWQEKRISGVGNAFNACAENLAGVPNYNSTTPSPRTLPSLSLIEDAHHPPECNSSKTPSRVSVGSSSRTDQTVNTSGGY